jgi:hypothetical protein
VHAKNPDPRAESKLAEAAERATALLQQLQTRLNREAGADLPAPRVLAPAPTALESAEREETADDLERQLQQYFASAPRPAGPPSRQRNVLNDIRDRVVDRVADRILRAWEEPGGPAGALEEAVMERVVERILERLAKDDRKSSGSAGF